MYSPLIQTRNETPTANNYDTNNGKAEIKDHETQTEIIHQKPTGLNAAIQNATLYNQFCAKRPSE